MGARLRVGIVGAGWVSAYHLIAWKALDTAEVVAIADLHRGKAEGRALEFAIPGIRESAAEMLEKDHLDALDIATPVETHADHCRLAADRGVAILCQKPLAPTLAEAQELVRDIAGRSRLMVNENWRFRPHYRRVKRWIEEESIGTARQFRLATRSSGLVADADGTMPALSRQPFLATLKRLVVGELLIHHLDVARWLLGPLNVRDAIAVRGRVVGEHAATILLSSSDGCIAVVEGNMAACGYPSTPIDALDIVGTVGSVRLESGELKLSGRYAEQHRIDLGADYQQGFCNAVSHFASGLRAHQPFETDAMDNLSTLALVDAVYSRMANG